MKRMLMFCMGFMMSCLVVTNLHASSHRHELLTGRSKKLPSINSRIFQLRMEQMLQSTVALIDSKVQARGVKNVRGLHRKIEKNCDASGIRKKIVVDGVYKP